MERKRWVDALLAVGIMIGFMAAVVVVLPIVTTVMPLLLQALTSFLSGNAGG